MFFWGPVLGYAVLLFYFSSLPASEIPEFHLSDKILHFLAYAGFGFLFVRGFRPQGKGWGARRVLFIATVGSALYGLTDEWHQSFVPTRQSEFADLIMDGFGGMFGGLFFLGRIYAWRR